MKFINNYDNIAAYNADTNRPSNANTVSNIKDEARRIYNGRNVVVERQFCGVGDTAVYDTVDLRMKVVKLDTLIIAELPARYKVVGTVYMRDERQAYMVSNDVPPNLQWGADYQVKLSNLPTTGTFTLTVNALTTAAITASSDLSTMAANIQAALRVILTAPTWTATAYANYILVRQTSYTPIVTIFTCSDAGTVVNITTGNYQTALTGLLTANQQLFRKDGSVSNWAGGNFLKFKDYYSVNGTDATGHTLTEANVLRLSRFNATDNPIPYNYYAGSYDAYIQAKMTKKPYSKGVIMTETSGKINTYKLSPLTYTAHDGTTQPAYPAAAYCAGYGIAGTPYTAGSWWLFSVYEYYPLIEKITYGAVGVTIANMDAINRGIYAATGATNRLINITNRQWLSNEYNANNVWAYNGDYGYLTSRSKYISLGVLCCSAFPL